MPKLNIRNSRWLWVTVFVFFLDQISKQAVLQHFLLGESMRILPMLNFTLAYNRGSAFSLFAGWGTWIPWFFAILSISISAFLFYSLLRLSKNEKLMAIALTGIIGGALGNLYDRLQYGYVIDFIHAHWGIHSFPIFNLADSAICLGAAMIFLLTWRRPS